MPSRKKKQGRARKAKQAEIRSSNPHHASSDCNHLDQNINSNSDDFEAAIKLRIKFESTLNALIDDDRIFSDVDALGGSVLAMIHDAYDEYFQFSDEGKEIFKQIMLAAGTKLCISEAKQKDLTKETIIPGILHFVQIIQSIEVRDSHGGTLSDSIMNEIQILANDTLSPRETVRFFHRRNSCDCLKELYYKLKENTARTSFCYNCCEMVDIRKMSQCECKITRSTNYTAPNGRPAVDLQMELKNAINHSVPSIESRESMSQKNPKLTVKS